MDTINTSIRSVETSKAKLFAKISYYAYLITVALVPIFFIPFTTIAFDISKSYLISIGICTSFTFWLLAKLLDGNISLPKTPLIFAFLGTLFFTVLSSLFSVAPNVSFIGTGFDIGTTSSILLMFLTLFLGSVLIGGSSRKSSVYFLILGVSIISILWQLVLIIVGPNTLGIGIFSSKTINLIGKWSDFAVFLGAIVLLAVAMVELLKIGKIQKIFTLVLIGACLFFLMLINSISAWVLVGLFSLIIFIYAMTVIRNGNATQDTNNILEKRFFPAISFSVVMISLVFILANPLVGQIFSDNLGVYNVEFRPSVSTTFEVAKQVLVQDPVFGFGANRFENAWAQFRPVRVLQTTFWDTNFSQGFGFIPTFLVTSGPLVFLSLLFFLVYFFYFGIKKVFSFSIEPMANFFLLSSFILAAYFLIFLWISVPNITIVFLTFVMIGIFINTLEERKLIGQYKISFLKDPRKSFFSILTISVLFIATLSMGYIYTKKFVAVAYTDQGFRRTQNVDTFNKAEKSFVSSARNNSKADFAYQNLANYYYSKLNILMNSSGLSDEFVGSQFQSYFLNAENSAKLAISKDRTNFFNWVLLGNIYKGVVPLDIEGSYESAKASYESALVLNPNSPSIYLLLARLELANDNIPQAKINIDKALALKQNYGEALFLTSQIYLEEGNNDEALNRIVQALFADPSNIEYEYLLGVVYEKLGREKDAIAVFKDINNKIPGNKQIESILEKLEKGQNIDAYTETLETDTIDSAESQ